MCLGSFDKNNVGELVFGDIIKGLQSFLILLFQWKTDELCELVIY